MTPEVVCVTTIYWASSGEISDEFEVNSIRAYFIDKDVDNSVTIVKWM